MLCSLLSQSCSKHCSKLATLLLGASLSSSGWPFSSPASFAAWVRMFPSKIPFQLHLNLPWGSLMLSGHLWQVQEAWQLICFLLQLVAVGIAWRQSVWKTAEVCLGATDDFRMGRLRMAAASRSQWQQSCRTEALDWGWKFSDWWGHRFSCRGLQAVDCWAPIHLHQGWGLRFTIYKCCWYWRSGFGNL